MGRKTKKQKIIAELRRKLQIDNISPLASHPTPPIQIQSLYIYPVRLIRKDLTKTLLLSILAISLEVAIYFFLEKNLTLPFIK